MSLDLPVAALPEAVAAGLAGFPPAEAGRALAALAVLAAPLIDADAARAWRSSRLTGDGFPLELGFTTADAGLRWTFDPAAPGLPPAARLEAALAGLARLGQPDPEVARLARRLQPDAKAFGGWIGGRSGDRFKLYVDMPDGPAAAAALDAVGIARPRLQAVPRTRMLGLGPGARTEAYFRAEATRHCLPRVLEPAGLAAEADRIAALVEEAWGNRIRDRLPGGSVGISYARAPGDALPVVTIFFFARALWGGDARIRERMLARLAAAGTPSGPYAAASRPVAGRRRAATRHGLVGITVLPGSAHWSVGLRPVAGP
jgi:hypothetical protein